MSERIISTRTLFLRNSTSDKVYQISVVEVDRDPLLMPDQNHEVRCSYGRYGRGLVASPRGLPSTLRMAEDRALLIAHEKMRKGYTNTRPSDAMIRARARIGAHAAAVKKVKGKAVAVAVAKKSAKDIAAEVRKKAETEVDDAFPTRQLQPLPVEI